MEMFLDCASCAGFIPHAADACPHCGKAVSRKKKAKAAGKTGLLATAATVATGGLMSITLMACYGIAYTCEGPDADGDGYKSESSVGECFEDLDCNDSDASIYPGAEDSLGDDIDQNCDGVDGNAEGSGGAGGGGTGGGGGAGGG
jgi:hypothetical protein